MQLGQNNWVKGEEIQKIVRSFQNKGIQQNFRLQAGIVERSREPLQAGSSKNGEIPVECGGFVWCRDKKKPFLGEANRVKLAQNRWRKSACAQLKRLLKPSQQWLNQELRAAATVR